MAHSMLTRLNPLSLRTPQLTRKHAQHKRDVQRWDPGFVFLLNYFFQASAGVREEPDIDIRLLAWSGSVYLLHDDHCVE